MQSILRESRLPVGARHRAHWAWMLMLVLGPDWARAGDVSVALDEGDRVCRVRGSFVAPISGAVAWGVLSDYDHIPRFVSSMVSSRATRDANGQLLVHQVVVGRVFLLRRRLQVTLETHEESGRRIDFRDVLGKDFIVYAGGWEIAPDSTGARVSYRLEAKPRSSLARAFCRGTLERTAEDLLEQVRAEMIRRASAGK